MKYGFGFLVPPAELAGFLFSPVHFVHSLAFGVIENPPLATSHPCEAHGSD